ncbi:uncharacterized protein LOC126975819 isoform X2 [Leptidea sinapis]|uniref:uncharacterized protein LOC126975819 isoform X2 n=1 Tax=Leptidea sinapis TaxID=189913 RepID=UPI0021372AF9|nr:uncharacterized protein LOC126975819 isoform X2 [Leptidea sinapis]
MIQYLNMFKLIVVIFIITILINGAATEEEVNTEDSRSASTDYTPIDVSSRSNDDADNDTVTGVESDDVIAEIDDIIKSGELTQVIPANTQVRRFAALHALRDGSVDEDFYKSAKLEIKSRDITAKIGKGEARKAIPDEDILSTTSNEIDVTIDDMDDLLSPSDLTRVGYHKNNRSMYPDTSGEISDSKHVTWDDDTSLDRLPATRRIFDLIAGKIPPQRQNLTTPNIFDIKGKASKNNKVIEDPAILEEAKDVTGLPATRRIFNPIAGKIPPQRQNFTTPNIFDIKGKGAKHDKVIEDPAILEEAKDVTDEDVYKSAGSEIKSRDISDKIGKGEAQKGIPDEDILSTTSNEIDETIDDMDDLLTPSDFTRVGYHKNNRSNYAETSGEINDSEHVTWNDDTSFEGLPATRRIFNPIAGKIPLQRPNFTTPYIFDIKGKGAKHDKVIEDPAILEEAKDVTGAINPLNNHAAISPSVSTLPPLQEPELIPPYSFFTAPAPTIMLTPRPFRIGQMEKAEPNRDYLLNEQIVDSRDELNTVDFFHNNMLKNNYPYNPPVPEHKSQQHNIVEAGLLPQYHNIFSKLLQATSRSSPIRRRFPQNYGNSYRPLYFTYSLPQTLKTFAPRPRRFRKEIPSSEIFCF